MEAYCNIGGSLSKSLTAKTLRLDTWQSNNAIIG